jgi:protein-tyrosine-phosphatase
LSDIAPAAPTPAPDAPPGVSRPRQVQSVLFMCALNQVRSPMAEALAKHFFGKSIYVQSAGVRKGEVDGFMLSALEEMGIDAKKHRPRTVDELEEWEGLNFDLIVTLSPEAHHKALDLTRTVSADVEYWPMPDPTLTQGTREQILEGYREVRDALQKRIIGRFR